MDDVLAESAWLPVPGQGRFPAVAILAKTCCITRPVSGPQSISFFVNHQLY